MKKMPIKILIVDDDDGNNNVLRLALQEEFQVLSARDGAQALDILDNKEHHDIRAIITDQRMPGLSGSGLLKQSVHSHPHALRVIVTGYPDLEKLNHEPDMTGIDKIFYKPLTDPKIEELSRFLREGITGRPVL